MVDHSGNAKSDPENGPKSDELPALHVHKLQLEVLKLQEEIDAHKRDRRWHAVRTLGPILGILIPLLAAQAALYLSLEEQRADQERFFSQQEAQQKTEVQELLDAVMLGTSHQAKLAATQLGTYGRVGAQSILVALTQDISQDIAARLAESLADSLRHTTRDHREAVVADLFVETYEALPLALDGAADRLNRYIPAIVQMGVNYPYLRRPIREEAAEFLQRTENIEYERLLELLGFGKELDIPITRIQGVNELRFYMAADEFSWRSDYNLTTIQQNVRVVIWFDGQAFSYTLHNSSENPFVRKLWLMIDELVRKHSGDAGSDSETP